MVEFGTAQAPRKPIHTGSIRYRTPSSSQSDPSSSLRTQPAIPRPPQSLPLLRERGGIRQAHSTILESTSLHGQDLRRYDRTRWETIFGVMNDYVVVPMRGFPVLAVVMVLIWLPVLVKLLVDMYFQSVLENVHPPRQQPHASSKESRTSPPFTWSSSPAGAPLHEYTTIPMLAHLVKKQADILETFEEALARLNTPITLNVTNSQHTSPSDDGSDHNKSADQTTDDPYGLVNRVAASRKDLPPHMTMKLAELAMVDLKVAVKHSGISDSTKELLVEHLETFHGAAKVHTRKLQFLEARSRGCIDGQIAQNVFLSAELDRLERMSKGKIGVWSRIRKAFSPSHDSDQEAATIKSNLLRLYSTTFQEGRKQLRMLTLQIMDLQQGIDGMDQTRRTIQDIMGRERGEQQKMEESVMADLWEKLGRRNFEQETYRMNLALLDGMDRQQKLTGGHLQWILLKLTGFEADLALLWERMVDTGVFGAQEGGSDQGQETFKRAESTSTPSSDQAGDSQEKTTFSLRDIIEQIENVTSNLKATRARASGQV